MRNLEREKAYKMMSDYVNQFEEMRAMRSPKFFQDKNSGMTACYIKFHNKSEDTMEDRWGFAQCSPTERWNGLTGKYLALKRAVSGRVPKLIKEQILSV